MIILFAVDLHWLPAGGYVPLREDPVENLRHMVMPAIVLGTGFSAVLMRQMRSSMLDSLGADYVRTARAKGLPRVHGRRKPRAPQQPDHRRRRSSGSQFGALISGAVDHRAIFGIPGFGRLDVDAINQRDYALIQGVVLVAARRLRRRQPARRRRLLAARIRGSGSPGRRVSVVEAAAARACPRARAPAPPAPQALPAPAARGGRPRRRDRVRPRRDLRAVDRALRPVGDRLQRAARAAVVRSTCSAPTSSAATSSRASSGARARRSRRASSRRCSRW